MPLNDYKTYADALTDGYIKAARFLVQQSILVPRDLPYTTQLIPLSVLMAVDPFVCSPVSGLQGE